MKRTAFFFTLFTFSLMLGISYLVAERVAGLIEARTEADLEKAIAASGEEWVSARADGFVVLVSGLAPNETARLRAYDLISQLVDSDRIRDEITVLRAGTAAAPRFSLELLRDINRVSLIGLTPQETGRAAILTPLQRHNERLRLTDMLETADHPIPEGWEEAVAFGLESINILERSKISITPGKVTITAVTGSPEEKAAMEGRISKIKPEAIQLIMSITAPRPVISPFRFQAVISGGQMTVQNCTADRVSVHDDIIDVIAEQGASIETPCQIGLGVPTANWGKAVIESITATAGLTDAVLSLRDTDVTLIARREQDAEAFSLASAQLLSALPPLFNLKSIAPVERLDETDANPNPGLEFQITRIDQNRVEIRGNFETRLQKNAMIAYARSEFVGARVIDQSRIDDAISFPGGFSRQLATGIDALAYLADGQALVSPSGLVITGRSGEKDIVTKLRRLTAEQLGESAQITLDVRYDEGLVPNDESLSPLLCAKEVNLILINSPIAFGPGSASIEPSSRPTIKSLADVLRKCPDARFEVAGHTDSQGGEEMNKFLSQSRAEAVLSALLAERVIVSGLNPKGYGEEQPIASNDTEEGRAQNRRITFTALDEAGEVLIDLQTARPAPQPAEADPTSAPAAQSSAESLAPQPLDDTNAETTE